MSKLIEAYKSVNFSGTRIFIAGGSQYREYANWITGAKIVGRFGDANLVLFAGGEDVSPGMYGESAHPTTSANWRRDVEEADLFNTCQMSGVPTLGICRGSQFLCVSHGGKLVQHQSHPGSHKITVDFESIICPGHLSDKDKAPVPNFGEKLSKITGHETGEIVVTSTHHQRQYPWPLDKRNTKFKVVGVCELSPFSFGSSDKDDLSKHDGKRVPEVEIAVYRRAANALAIQSHPEYVFPAENDRNKEYIGYCKLLLWSCLSDSFVF